MRHVRMIVSLLGIIFITAACDLPKETKGPTSDEPVDIYVTRNDTAVPAGQVLDIGSCRLGEHIEIVFTVANIGISDNLTLQDVGLVNTQGDCFAVTDRPAPGHQVAPGGSAAVTVTYTPAACEDYSATLTILNSDPDESAYTITLTGNGVDPVLNVIRNGQILGTTTHISLGDVDVGDTLEVVFTVENAGTSDLIIEEINLGFYDPAEESFDEPVHLLAPGQSDEMIFTYTPVDYEGVDFFSITIISNDPDKSPTYLQTKVTANAPEIETKFSEYSYGYRNWSNDHMDFDLGLLTLNTTTPPIPLEVHNTGNRDLQLGGFTLSGDTGHFNVTGPATAALAPNDSDYFQLTATAYDYSIKRMTISLQNNDPVDNPFAVNLAFRGCRMLPGDVVGDCGIFDFAGDIMAAAGDGPQGVHWVNVFRRTAGEWTLDQTLQFDAWGGYISQINISGDTIIVSETVSGSVANPSRLVMYRRDGSLWVRLPDVLSPESHAYDYFGLRTAVHGDNLAASDTDGNVFFFHYQGGSWNFINKVELGGRVRYMYITENFFFSVNYSQPWRTVHVYRYEGSNWGFYQDIAHDDICQDDAPLGCSYLAASGDYMVVASKEDRYSFTCLGFRFDGTAWVFDRVIGMEDLSNTSDYTILPPTVNIQGNTLLLTSRTPFEPTKRFLNNGDDCRGKVFVFRRTGDEWMNTDCYRPPVMAVYQGKYSAVFGKAVFDGDHVIIAAAQDIGGMEGVGALYYLDVED